MGLIELLKELASVLMEIIRYFVGFMVESLSKILGFFGLQPSVNTELILAYVLAFIVLLALMDHAMRLFGKWIINSIAGAILLLVIHYLLGVAIPLNAFTVVVTVLFGVPGVLALLVLYLAGAFPTIP